jgi:hypothetical protein
MDSSVLRNFANILTDDERLKVRVRKIYSISAQIIDNKPVCLSHRASLILVSCRIHAESECDCLLCCHSVMITGKTQICQHGSF